MYVIKGSTPFFPGPHPNYHCPSQFCILVSDLYWSALNGTIECLCTQYYENQKCIRAAYSIFVPFPGFIYIILFFKSLDKSFYISCLYICIMGSLLRSEFLFLLDEKLLWRSYFGKRIFTCEDTFTLYFNFANFQY